MEVLILVATHDAVMTLLLDAKAHVVEGKVDRLRTEFDLKHGARCVASSALGP